MPAAKLTHLLSLILIIGCSGNPFGETEIAPPDRVLRGRVQLAERTHADGVYVWLQGFNLSTWSDPMGRFELMLPPEQAGGGSVSGVVKLYYYMANYDVTTTDILIRNGALLQPQPSLDAEGSLLHTVMLRQKLKIETDIQPNSLSNSHIKVTRGKTNFLLKVKVSIQAPRDPVVVFFPRAVKSLVAPIIFKNIRTGQSKIISSTIAGISEADISTVNRQPHIRTFAVPMFPQDLDVGDYEIIPYLFIEDPEIPEQLLASLGHDVMDLGDGYLKLPFVRQGTDRILHVKP